MRIAVAVVVVAACGDNVIDKTAVCRATATSASTLEDRYAIRVSEEEAAQIETVGDAVDFVTARVPAA